MTVVRHVTIADFVASAGQATLLAPDGGVLADARDLIDHVRHLLDYVWLEQPLLHVFGPSLVVSLTPQIRVCCEQANLYEIGAVSDGELAVTLHSLYRILAQMELPLDEALRVHFNYANALESALQRVRPDLAQQYAGDVSATWNVLIERPPHDWDLANTIALVSGVFERIDALLSAAEVALLDAAGEETTRDT